MIRYALICAAEHGFESWFRDSAAFDQLSAAGQVACPACGTADVHKALMAPSVVTARSRARTPVEPAPAEAAAPPRPVALVDDKARELRTMMRDLHTRIVAQSDNVGRAFAAEARAIHEGDAPPRSIYGEATRDEVRALVEDDIPLMPMPVPPDDHH